MTFTWGPPVDPAYTAFVSGLKAHIAQTGLPARWRWHPRNATWYSYSLDHYELVDVGMPASRKAVTWAFPGQPPTFFDSQVVDLFTATQEAYRLVAQHHPHATWDPVTGSWLDARSNDHAPPPPPPLWPPAEMVRRISDVRKLVEQRVITPEEGERRIDAIIKEYT